MTDGVCKYSICLLDDKIPLPLEPGIIEHRTLRALLSDESKWKDKFLFELVNQLVSEETEDKYILSGFTHCDFFLNHKKESIFSPDIIIFDWDYPGGDPGTTLLEILECQYCKIVIFTEVDVEEEVHTVIKKGEFEKYEKRVEIIKKDGETDYLEKMKKVIEKALGTFSFKYSSELKRKTLKALDSILSTLDQLTFKDFVIMFGEKVKENNEKRRKLSALGFAEIITDKLKTKLIDVGFDEKNYSEKDSDTDIDDNLMREIWGFRLYHEPKDSVVRRGDVFEIKGHKVMVVSSDCDLAMFWQKNMGYLMLTHLYREDDPKLKKKLNDYNPKSIKNFSITSLTNPRCISSITVLPGFEFEEFEENDGEGIYWDYVVAAKETYSIEIKKPEKINNPQSPLHYEHLEEKDMSFANRKRIAEPFLTPLIQFIMQNITGLGVPDFSKSLQDSIHEKIEGLKNNAE